MISQQQFEKFNFPKEPPLPPIGASKVPKSSLGVENSINAIDSTNSIPMNNMEDNSFSNKLTNVEAQRIISVLQEAQKKVQLIGYLPDTIDRRVSTVFSGETITLITVWIIICSFFI